MNALYISQENDRVGSSSSTYVFKRKSVEGRDSNQGANASKVETCQWYPQLTWEAD